MQQVRVGDVEITSIVERAGPWRTPAEFFPTWDAARHGPRIAELEPEMHDPATGLLMVTYQTFVVRTPRRTILVDTCLGEDKALGGRYEYPKAPWLAGLRALGLTFEDVDYVLCTHLHFDHTGWNTRLVDGRWVPTFPRATYVFSELEYRLWEAATLDPSHPQARVFAMNLEPVVAAGQALLVDETFALDDEVTLTATPGHTPGHCCVNVDSGGARAVITGDLFHHGLQVLEPALHTGFCLDPAGAVASRRRWLDDAAGKDLVVLPIHFPDPVAGRIDGVAGDALRYRFLR